MTAPTPDRFRHEAALYRSDEELLAVAVPFLEGGAEAGDAVLLGLDRREQRLVLDAVGDTSGITPMVWNEVYSSPFAALELNRRAMGDLLDNGASRVRVLGQVPRTAVHGPWSGWARYEAAINRLFAPLDVWSVCPYDARTTPDDVLADVERTHTHLAAPHGGHQESPAYTDPATFIAQRARDEADPLESTQPQLAARNPTPAQARRMTTALAAGTTLDQATVDRFTLAVSEVVTNATLHGDEPVDIRGWAAPDRVVVTVEDHGPGPDDPFVGLLPRRDGPGGLGMWIAYQACTRMALLPGPDSFTVRLTAGTPPP